jgi:hypothetical protein
MLSIRCFIIPGLHLRTFEEPRMTAETAPSTVAPPGGEAGSKYQYYAPEYARMEAWLDEHPDFVQDYFLRCDNSRNYSRRLEC